MLDIVVRTRFVRSKREIASLKRILVYTLPGEKREVSIIYVEILS